jgi:hypothetical protein
MTVPRSPVGGSNRTDRTLTLRLEGFAWEALEEEAAHEGLAVADLITFSVLYYLADLDSGRLSRRISRSPYPRSSDDRLGGGDARPAPLSARPLSDRD